MGRFYPDRPKDNFAVLGLAFFQDARITNEAARTVLGYGLLRPDTWSHTISSLARELPLSEKVVRSAVRQLESLGFAVRVEWRGERGRYENDFVFCWPELTPEEAEKLKEYVLYMKRSRHVRDGTTDVDGMNATVSPARGDRDGMTVAVSPPRYDRGRHADEGTPSKEGGPRKGPKEGSEGRGAKEGATASAPPARGGAATGAGESSEEPSSSQGREGDAPVLDEKPKAKRKTHTFETDKPLILAALDKQERGEPLKPAEVALIGWAAYCDYFGNKVTAYATTRKKLMPAFTQTAKEDGTTADELMYAVNAWLTHPRVTVRTSPNAFRAFGLAALQERRGKRSAAVSAPSERGLGTRHQASRDNFAAAISQMSEQQLAEYL